MKQKMSPRLSQATSALAFALSTMALPPPVAAATEVNTCGQVYSGGGFLSADLDCSLFGSHAVIIEGGSFDLRGFTLTGGGNDAVRCTRSCNITSNPPGGQIVGAASDGVFGAVVGTQKTNVRVTNVVVDGNGSGVRTQSGTVSVLDAVITNNVGGPGFGVVAETISRAKVRRSTVTGNGSTGVGAVRVTVVDSDVSGNMGAGVDADRFVVKGSTINGNGEEGIHAVDGGKVVDSTVNGNVESGVDGLFPRLRVVRSDVSSNGEHGVFVHDGRISVKETTISGNGGDGVHNTIGDRTKVVKDSVVTGNGFYGVFTMPAVEMTCFHGETVRDSTVTGNGTDPDCGVTVTCADLAACEPPSISNVTCDTSYDTLSGFPGTSWGICSLD